MHNYYRQLVVDVRKALQESFSLNKVFLTSHHFPSSQPRPQEHPPLQPPEQEPLPPSPPSLPPVQNIKPNVPKVPSPSLKLQETVSKKEMKNFLGKIAPHLRILEDLPSDEEAIKVAERWKEKEFVADITLLMMVDTENEKVFLQNLVKAIDIRLKPARVIDAQRMEKENKWKWLLESTKIQWILAPPSLSSYPQLLRHYKEVPAVNQYFLGNVPLFFLQPISSYLKNPSLKVSLWQKLSMLL